MANTRRLTSSATTPAPKITRIASEDSTWYIDRPEYVLRFPEQLEFEVSCNFDYRTCNSRPHGPYSFWRKPNTECTVEEYSLAYTKWANLRDLKERLNDG